MKTITARIKARPDLYAALLLALLALLPLLYYLIRGLAPSIDEPESLAEWLPYRLFTNRTFSAGILPAWCPDLLAGFPFVAWAHSSVFSPIGVIYYLLPYAPASTVTYFFCAAVFGWGTYFFVRVFRASPPSATAAAVAAMAFFLQAEYAAFLPRMLSLSLSPLILGLLAACLRRPRLPTILAFALAAALQIIHGDLEIFGRTMVLAVMAAAIWLPLFGAGGRLPAALLSAGAGIALIALFAAPVLLPNLELIDLSTRQTVYPYEAYTIISGGAALLYLPQLALTALLSLALPAALILGRDRLSLLLALLVALCLAIGWNFLGILHLVRLVPVLNRLLWHIHMIPLASIPMALAAALALDRLRARPGRASLTATLLLAAAWIGVGIFGFFRSPTPISGAWSMAAAAVALAAAVVGARGRRGWEALIAAAVVGSWLAGLGGLRPIRPTLLDHDPSYPEFVHRLPEPSRVLDLVNHSYYDAMRIPYQAGIYYGSQSFDFYIQVIPMWSYDFYNLIKPFWRFEPGQKTNQLFDVFKHSDFIRRDNLKFLNFLNVLGLATDHENLRLAPDYRGAYFVSPGDCRPGPCRVQDALAAGSPRVTVRAPGRIRHRVDFAQMNRMTVSFLPGGSRLRYEVLTEVGGRKRLLLARGLQPDEAAPAVEIPLRLGGQDANLDFIALPDGRPQDAVWVNPTMYHTDPYFQLAGAHGDVRYYRNPKALPRAYLVHQAVVITDRKERLDFIKSDQFDPVVMAVIEQGPRLTPPNYGALSDSVRMDEYLPGRVKLHARTNADGLLVMSDTWYPGWRAWVDDQEQPILRANHAYEALRLPPGFHQVEFHYEPRPLRIGIWTALASFVAAAAVAAARRSRRAAG